MLDIGGLGHLDFIVVIREATSLRDRGAQNLVEVHEQIDLEIMCLKLKAFVRENKRSKISSPFGFTGSSS